MVFELQADERWFPDPEFAEPDGLLAFGGDLSSERLELAYQLGIFPWYSEESPILWYSPHKRFVLFPAELIITKSMRKIMGLTEFTITVNQAFEEVIAACANIKRKGQQGTWITDAMQQAYTDLHYRGLATSVEVWFRGKLVGGLYGILCGKVFCGESMFSSMPNTSKMALIWLCLNLGFELVDCQIYSTHLESMGARMIQSKEYMQILNHITRS